MSFSQEEGIEGKSDPKETVVNSETKGTDVSQGEIHDVDPVWVKSVVRKIDKRIVICCLITYTLNFIDKTLLGYSAMFGNIKSTVRLPSLLIFKPLG